MDRPPYPKSQCDENWPQIRFQSNPVLKLGLQRVGQVFRRLRRALEARDLAVVIMMVAPGRMVGINRSFGMRFGVIAMVKVKNKRTTLQQILASLFKVEVKHPASMKAGVMSGGLQHRMVARPLARTQRGQKICHPNRRS